MKKCFKCGISKVLSDFYKHPQMPDGHVNKCKDCNKSDNIRNRLEKIDYYRKYDKQRNSLDHRKKNNNKRCHEYRKKNPKIYKAHGMVNNAIRSGLIERGGSCESCGYNENLNAHHDDYNKPLVVRWLCSICHSDWHKNNEALNKG